jgi:Cu+-exporting ATPase
MTCVACVRAITDAVLELEGVSDVVVSQLGKSASAVVASPDLIPSVVTLIEDIGYECTVISITPTAEAGSATKRTSNQRSVALQLAGLESM